MPYLIGTCSGGRGVLSGKFLRAKATDYSVRTQIYPPPAVSMTARHSSWRIYANRLYMSGFFTENVMLDEHYRLLRQGIRPPVQKPTVAVGGGSTEQICYLSFWDELTGERSSLSEGASVTGSIVRAWSALPTSVPGEILRAEGFVAKTIGLDAVTGVGIPAKTNFDMFRPGDRVLFSSTPNRWTTIRTITGSATMTVDDLGIGAVSDTLTYQAVSRVSHVECWVSVAGTLPRLAARVRLGTTAFTESVPTLSLGEAFLENFDLMPSGRINAIYGDRQLVAGVARHEDEVFLSSLFFPERWGGLSFKTRHGEPIVGIVGADDYAELLTPDSSYILQGYTEDDLTLSVGNPSLGGFGHNTNVQVEANIWIPNRKNFYLYPGWKPMCADRNTEWNESYLTSQRAFEEGLTIYNPNDATIQFYPYYQNGTLKRENIWVADFSSVKSDAGGEYAQPSWIDDDYRAVPEGDTNETGRQAVTDFWGNAAYLIPDGQKIGKLYRVSFPDGQIYYEDDAVPYHRTAVAKLPHYLWTEETDNTGADTVDHGWLVDTLWAHVRSENSAWQIGLWLGDAYASENSPMGLVDFSRFNIAAPQWNDGFVDVAASLLEDVAATTYLGQNVNYIRWAPKMVHIWRPLRTGRGATAELRFLLPKNASFFGIGGKCIPGRASRGVIDAELFLG